MTFETWIVSKDALLPVQDRRWTKVERRTSMSKGVRWMCDCPKGRSARRSHRQPECEHVLFVVRYATGGLSVYDDPEYVDFASVDGIEGVTGSKVERIGRWLVQRFPAETR